MGVFRRIWWVLTGRRGNYISNNPNLADESSLGVLTRQLNLQIKQLEQMAKIKRLKEQITDMQDFLDDGEEDDGDTTNPIESKLMNAFADKLLGNSNLIQGIPNPNTQQLNLEGVQQIFMEWANDHQIKTESIQDLQRRLKPQQGYIG